MMPDLGYLLNDLNKFLDYDQEQFVKAYNATNAGIKKFITLDEALIIYRHAKANADKLTAMDENQKKQYFIDLFLDL